ncbi:PH domain-containing protein [Nocardia grenadensis]|uniref:PH domain-containing protein n=1 Tax=Nocardia grenadensis TaxID=931537 RepID=UPI000A0756D7|nr:PH domain-containing protein [Nocardia grenadensis]
MTGPHPAGGSGPAAEPETVVPGDDEPWLRLDRRMLLVHPVQEIVKFLPAVIGAVVLGVSSGNPLYSLLGLVFVIPYALTLWFTTTYRVGPTHVELRTGLIRRKRLAVPRARIRSVDIEADPLHRILGLAVMVIGTGQEAEAGDRFRLDALAAGHVRPLRAELLAHTRTPPTPTDDPTPVRRPGIEPEVRAAELGVEIGHWQPGWVRYAPLSLTGFALAASALGLAAQFGFGAAEIGIGHDTVETVRDFGVLSLLAAGVAALLVLVVVVSVAACAHYLATYYGLRVTDHGSTLQIRRGLFTLRRITLDTARLRGATIREPLLLRLAGAAQLEAVMTGENPRQKILPQAPRAAVERTLARLLSPHRDANTSATAAQLAALADIPLTRHGPAARRRRYIRACWPVPLTAAALLLAAAAGWQVTPWWWLLPAGLTPVCALLAADRYRGLGHAVVPATAGSPAWLVVRSGSLDRERTCLEAPGIIGWTVRQTFWQRRAGLATLGAATAAGKKLYLVHDIPLDRVWTVLDGLAAGVPGHRPSTNARPTGKPAGGQGEP